MRNYAFRIVNVFAERTLGGNPLCVFENATGMSDEEMQALARQFNLSETTFIFPSVAATAKMRIFTPDGEMAFAGHPTLGSAHVVSSLHDGVQQLNLECKGGIVAVKSDDHRWTLTVPPKSGPHVAVCDMPGAQVASLLGLRETDLLSAPVWVNTGSEQLLVSLKSTEAVLRAQPDGAQLAAWPANRVGRKSAFVFAFNEHQAGHSARTAVTSRYFFVRQGGGVAEDPGTGSACANLGAWWAVQGRDLPISMLVSQGEQVKRPSQLFLDMDDDKMIRVGGKVIEIAQGQVQI